MLRTIACMSAVGCLMLAAGGTSLGQESAYITGDRVNERLCPSTDCPSTNRLYRGQRVDVFERRDGWARVTKYYDSSAERAEFPSIQDLEVARWVAEQFISSTKPAPLEQPDFDAALLDPRIQGIPDVGEFGLTAAEITLLRKYSLKLLQSGACASIEYGDKSVNKPDTYYVACSGDTSNRFFTARDVE